MELTNEQLKEALKKAQGHMIGLASTLHYDDLIQASLIQWAEEIPLPLSPFQQRYVDRVKTRKGDVLGKFWDHFYEVTSPRKV